jgi:Spy/CpxP family protein refolding chaperone
MMRMMAAHLDLTDEQRSQARALAEQHRESTKELRAELRQARRALRDAIQAEAFNETSIRSAAAVVAAAEAEMAVVRARHRQDFEALLTPEQLAELDQFRQQRKERREDFRGGGRGPHGFGDCPYADPQNEE